jgi:hypothetical protein
VTCEMMEAGASGSTTSTAAPCSDPANGPCPLQRKRSAETLRERRFEFGLGIENMCINTMVAATGSKTLHAVVWDEWYAQLDRDNVAYPSIVNPMKGGISPSWGLDGCKQTPTLLARWLDGAVGTGAEFAQSGWSADDGATWNAFATLPASTTGASDWGYGGELAYSGEDNLVVVSSNTNGVSSVNGQLRMPYYTLDRGATWKPVTLPTAWTEANASKIHSASYLNREILVADDSQLARSTSWWKPTIRTSAASTAPTTAARRGRGRHPSPGPRTTASGSTTRISSPRSPITCG